jgi:hypothetical protein
MTFPINGGQNGRGVVDSSFSVIDSVIIKEPV